MKKYFLLAVFLFWTPFTYAYEWSVNDYIENCSVVHLKTITDAEQKTIGYCMGVLKGAFSGVIVSRSLESGDFQTPSCISSDGQTNFIDVQKNVLATMRLKYKAIEAASEPNTATAAVAYALIELYPCLAN